MDFDLIITSFPKLLGATLVTLKLLSASLFFGMILGLLFAILRLNNNKHSVLHGTKTTKWFYAIGST